MSEPVTEHWELIEPDPAEPVRRAILAALAEEAQADQAPGGWAAAALAEGAGADDDPDGSA